MGAEGHPESTGFTSHCAYDVVLKLKEDAPELLFTCLAECFLDKEFRDDVDLLEIAENIGSELLKAIQKSKVLVIPWPKDAPPDELVKVLEPERNSGHLARLVFPWELTMERRSNNAEETDKTKFKWWGKVEKCKLEEVADIIRGTVLQNQSYGLISSFPNMVRLGILDSSTTPNLDFNDEDTGDKGWRGALQKLATIPGFTLQSAVAGTRVMSLNIDLLAAASAQKYPSRSFPYFCGCYFHIALICKYEFEDNMDRTFPERLFVGLVKEGFHTFLDSQKIEREEEPIKYSGRKQIIQQSNCCIPIFFKDSASSKGHLDELVTILDRYSTCTHRILPVYYGVDQSDVRNQLESFKAAFLVHEKEIEDETDEERKKKLEDDVRKWRAALRKVATLPSINFPNAANDSESEEALIKKIVMTMKDPVRREFPKGKEPLLVGVESRANSINLWRP